ncbi:RNA polymerase sigma-70 factor [Phocaeicola oris]|uniref:RNA polymerase sigma-70 factor n=1 Tax=Phocaeicola oris TaxID=2896850 RepID=UPI00234EC219|nr:RNA polymerase sigma-70 factor [Phocaeicola oris]MCE2616618.1 RNA polymerase sigma-70 factor [Phocaeicola oris]
MEGKEQEIIHALKRGEEQAFRYVYDHHYIILCKVANDFVEDPSLAEMIVEDVISHLWEIRKTLDIQSSLRRYLMRAVRNRCINYLESEQVKWESRFSNFPYEIPEKHFLFEKDIQHPLGYLLEKEMENEIIKAVKAIPYESQKIFRESRFDHRKNEDIAKELGISVDTVKYHIKKSLAFLREKLSDYLT